MIYFWAIFGAVIGSFLNLCIHRLPRGESIVWPASHCPSCGRSLSPLDLIPVLGYLLLLGKCRYCGRRISVRYPLVELLAAAGFALAWAQAGADLPRFAFMALFIAAALVIFFSDLETQLIPDAAVLAGGAAGLAYNYYGGLSGAELQGLNTFVASLYGLVLGYALLFLIGKAGALFFKKEALGEGDPYVGAMLGAGLGWGGALLAIFTGYLLAALVLLALLPTGRVRLGQYIPFGPALAAGGILVLFLGRPLIAWYLGI